MISMLKRGRREGRGYHGVGHEYQILMIPQQGRERDTGHLKIILQIRSSSFCQYFSSWVGGIGLYKEEQTRSQSGCIRINNKDNYRGGTGSST